MTIKYAQRYCKSLGGHDLYEKCGIKNLKDLFAEIYLIDVFENSAGGASYRLRVSRGDRGLSVREKEEKFKKISKSSSKSTSSSYCSKSYATELYNKAMKFDDDNDDNEFDDEFERDPNLKLPPQPEELLPPGGRMPSDVRYRVYRLLRNRFPCGINIVAFNIAYSKYYKYSINAQTECKMTFQEVFRSMRDIIDVGEDDAGQLCIRAKPLAMLKHIAKALQRPPLRNVLDLKRLPRRPPTNLPVEIREKFEKLLKYSDDLSLPYANFKTLFTQRSMLALFTVYGFVNYDQVVELALNEKLLEIYVLPGTDQKRIRLVVQ